jgi:D-serine deaminase-like pyridoxal phosphate-dependent protein
MNFFDLDTPALLVDLDRVEANVAEMAQLARSAGVALRPHTKTHKMPAIARLQVAAGARGLTVAKVGEAEVMAAAGFDDLLVAYPVVVPGALRRLAALRERASVRVTLDTPEVAEALSLLGRGDAGPVEVLVEVDTGLHRLGRPAGRATADLVVEVAKVPGVRVVGLLTHAGHIYSVAPAQRHSAARAEVEALLETRALCEAQGVEIVEVSVGSTPSVREELALGGVTEVRPGTYVFNDVTMIDLEVATEVDCAQTVLTTVVGHPAPGRFVVDAGTKALAADGVGQPGWVRFLERPDLAMEFLSEEHGVATASASRPAIGEQLRVIPHHACPVSNLFDLAYVVRGARVTEEIVVAGRGRSQ